MFCDVHGHADILEVDIAFLVAVFILFILSIIVAGKLHMYTPTWSVMNF